MSVPANRGVFAVIIVYRVMRLLSFNLSAYSLHLDMKAFKVTSAKALPCTRSLSFDSSLGFSTKIVFRFGTFTEEVTFPQPFLGVSRGSSVVLSTTTEPPDMLVSGFGGLTIGCGGAGIGLGLDGTATFAKGFSATGSGRFFFTSAVAEES